ncbi:MAG: type II CRISPR-associated endonuclease Cas1 [Bacteroidota bacterium]
MLKKTLFIETPCHLQIENELIKLTNKITQESNTFVPDELGYIILENYQITASIQFFQIAATNNILIIVCDKTHNPVSYTIPLYYNTTQTQTLNNQIKLKTEHKRMIWKQIIISKIQNQANLLKKMNKDYLKLMKLLEKATLDNIETCESTASRFYWKELFEIKKFKRDSEGEPPNNLLNYGYSILRAATARALIGSGLMPQISLHHHNKYDPLPLADDVMEPYRPFVDQIVVELVKKDDYMFLHKRNKQELLKILACDTIINEVRRPLMIALTYTTSSLANIINNKNKKISVPIMDV